MNAAMALRRMMTETLEPDLPTQVCNALQQRRACLFVRGDDGFVLRPVLDGQVLGVVIWVGWGQGGAPARHLPEVCQLARRVGARWLRFHTARRGFLRVAPRLGFVRLPDDESGLMVFEREVTHE